MRSEGSKRLRADQRTTAPDPRLPAKPPTQFNKKLCNRSGAGFCLYLEFIPDAYEKLNKNARIKYQDHNTKPFQQITCSIVTDLRWEAYPIGKGANGTECSGRRRGKPG